MAPQIARMLGPVVVTTLLIGWGTPGWLVLGGLFLAAGLLSAPVIRWAERTRPASARHPTEFPHDRCPASSVAAAAGGIPAASTHTGTGASMRIRIRRLATIGVAATAMTLAAATPALADPVALRSAGAGPGARAAKVCAKVPDLDARVDKVLARLQGGPDVPGSVEFVKKRAERARANGHTDLATALDSRAKARADLIPVLQNKEDGLPKLTEWCTKHGHKVGK